MATKKTFNFKLNDPVKLALTGERGKVIGRAHYVDSNPGYLIAYQGGDGCLRSEWFTESLVQAA